MNNVREVQVRTSIVKAAGVALAILLASAAFALQGSVAAESEDAPPTTPNSSPCHDLMEAVRTGEGQSDQLELTGVAGTQIPTRVWSVAALGNVTCVGDGLEDQVNGVLLEFAVPEEGDAAMYLMANPNSDHNWAGYLRDTLAGSGYADHDIRTHELGENAYMAMAGEGDTVSRLEEAFQDQSSQRQAVWPEVLRQVREAQR